MRHGLHPVVATVMVMSLCQTACMSYTQIEPADVGDYDKVRITRHTGDKESLRDPHTAGDTLTGIRSNGDTLRMSVSRVQEFSVGETHEGRTAALLGGVILVTAAVGLVLLAVTMDDANFP